MNEDQTLTGEVLPDIAPAPTRGPGGRFAGGAVPGGGRRPGGISKRTRDSMRIAEDLGFHPVEFMIRLVQTGRLMEENGDEIKLPLDERLKILREVAHYICPKIHGLQVTGRDGGPIQHAHIDVTHIMMDPVPAEMAESLALAMLDEPALLPEG
jgi:hypothetical protein